MTDLEKKLMVLFSSTIPLMTEREKERLMDFGDGMRYMAQTRIRANNVQQAMSTASGNVRSSA